MTKTKARRAVAVALAALLMALLAGCGPRGGRPAGASAPPAAVPPVTRAVEVFGVVRSEEVRSLVIEFGARVSRVLVDPGAAVDPGQPLVVLDASEIVADLANLDLQIEAAELRIVQRRQEIERADLGLAQEIRSVEREIASRDAELGRARTELGQLGAAIRDGGDLDLLAAEREVGRLAADLDLASRDLDVGRRLFAQGGISQAQLDQRERAVIDLRARLEAAELQLAQTREAKSRRITDLEFQAHQLGSTIESLRFRLEALVPSDAIEVRVQEVQTEQLRLQRHRLAARLERDFLARDGATVEVRSPFGPAVATDVTATPGDFLSSGARVARIVATDSLFVEAFVPEEFIRDVALLAPVRVTALADRTRSWRGHVEHVAGLAEQRGNETVFRIRVRVDETDGFLRPGMNVDLSIGATPDDSP